MNRTVQKSCSLTDDFRYCKTCNLQAKKNNNIMKLKGVNTGFPLVLKCPDFYRLKNQALKTPEIGYSS